MTALLKSGSGAMLDRVRPLGLHQPAPAADPERERLIEAEAALAAALAARDDEIAALKEEAEAALAEARAAGREEGRAEAEDRGADMIAALQGATERAAARLDEEMRAMERLAALLARTCLERMLIGSAARDIVVRDLLRAQVAALRSEAVVRIEVSAEDFADGATLEAMSAGLPCRVAASDALAAGDCTIALQLGTLEIGLAQQWGTLRDALDAMIDEGAGQ